jgi:hypothetical protein
MRRCRQEVQKPGQTDRSRAAIPGPGQRLRNGADACVRCCAIPICAESWKSLRHRVFWGCLQGLSPGAVLGR